MKTNHPGAHGALLLMTETDPLNSSVRRAVRLEASADGKSLLLVDVNSRKPGIHREVRYEITPAMALLPQQPLRRTDYPTAFSTVFRKIPIFSIWTSQTSPAFIKIGGVREKPTPEGVPVAMTSPGFNGTSAEA
jgi:hypothetical protein